MGCGVRGAGWRGDQAGTMGVRERRGGAEWVCVYMYISIIHCTSIRVHSPTTMASTCWLSPIIYNTHRLIGRCTSRGSQQQQTIVCVYSLALPVPLFVPMETMCLIDRYVSLQLLGDCLTTACYDGATCLYFSNKLVYLSTMWI